MNDIESGRLKFAGYRIGETYCLSPSSVLLAVDEVPKELVQVPGTKPWLLGVGKLGRELIPFINIARLLSIPRSDTPRVRSSALFVKGDATVGNLAIVVDELVCFVPSGELEDVADAEIKIPPGLGACFCGAVTDGSRAWALIDIQALASDSKIQKIDLT
ncbi:chemotaxis protein CheW [Pseudomonas sp. NPDC089569]|uniref:chemotaxis protein CheW n=1 Tax=Pseudomonas sp. NPDC089569 TaxID=3390722 RepID=UPI003CFF23C7